MSGSSILPKPREVWSVWDDDVVLHENKRVDKGNRYVLVVMLQDLIVGRTSVFNVIPLSASAVADRLSFPVAKAYEDVAKGFNPKDTSCAVVNFFQPLELKSFKNYKGRLDETTYEAIKTTLCKEVIGFNDLDYEV